MPIYEYHCDKCDKNIELVKKFSEADTATCPTCKSFLKRQVSQSSFHLKGTGWYKTDYTNSGSQSNSCTTGNCPIKSGV